MVKITAKTSIIIAIIVFIVVVLYKEGILQVKMPEEKQGFDPSSSDPRYASDEAMVGRPDRYNVGDIAERVQQTAVEGALKSKAQGVLPDGTSTNNTREYLDSVIGTQVVTPAIQAKHMEYMDKTMPYYSNAALFADKFDPTVGVSRSGIVAMARAFQPQEVASSGRPTQVTGIDVEDYLGNKRTGPRFI
jgi:hypothetical protein